MRFQALGVAAICTPMSWPIYTLENQIQHYAWGSPTAIPALVGQPNPTGKPWAELWMGAHHRAPSQVEHAGARIPLSELVDLDPDGILGPAVARRNEGKLLSKREIA